jgi:hypothetical protein
MIEDKTNDTQDIVDFYLGMGVDFFHKDFRMGFTKSVAKMNCFNKEYQAMFFGFYEQLAEDNVDDATNDAEYDDLLISEMNKINAFKMVVPKITIVLYTDDECRYYMDGHNEIIKHNFGQKGSRNMWV